VSEETKDKVFFVLVIGAILSLIFLVLFEVWYRSTLEWRVEWVGATIIHKQYEPSRLEYYTTTSRDSKGHTTTHSRTRRIPAKYFVFMNVNGEQVEFNDQKLFSSTINTGDKVLLKMNVGYDVKREKVTRTSFAPEVRRNE